MPELYRIIQFKRNCGGCGGNLVQFQSGDAETNALPFSIGKVLVMSDIRPDDVRGNHAHHETEEILVALTGGCVVDLDDGKGLRESVRLSACGSSGVRECGSVGVAEYGCAGVTERNKDSQTAQPPDPHTQAALLLYPHVWRTMRDFEPGTMLMVVASIKYDESDYIRDRADFERMAAKWTDPGGSASRCAGVTE